MRQLNDPVVVEEGLGYEVVLGDVVAEGLQAAYLVDDALAHEAGHACDAVDSDEVDE